MKHLKLTLLTAALALSLSGCGLFGVYGSGDVIESRYAYEDFTSVSVGWTCDLTVIKGDSFSVTVSVDDNIMAHVETYVSGNILYIDLERGYNYMNMDFSATVVMPEITYLEVSGASSASVTGFENGGAFKAVVSGASDADLDFISSGDLNCEVSGASSLKITSLSSSGDLDLECSGASDCDVRNAALNNGVVEVSGASAAYVNVSGSISGGVSGASTLYYSGAPVLGGINVSGASRLRRL